MTEHDRHAGRSDPRATVSVDAELERAIGDVEHAVDDYLGSSGGDQDAALAASLDALDRQTERSDAYESGLVNAPIFGFSSKGGVLGETSAHPFVERVLTTELQAQIELVRAAKREVAEHSLRSVEELRAASESLQAVRLDGRSTTP